MLETVLQQFDEGFQTHLKTTPSLLAVSGGLDSMVLADLFLKAEYPFSIAHVNFGLRKPDSDKDMELVRSFCEKHKIQVFFQNPDTKKYAEEKRLSVQMAAREIRYLFFEKCMAENQLQYLVTAHHATDNLENFFIYLLRNNQNAALSGISPFVQNRLRPLLEISKEKIREYAEKNEVIWREDSSNKNTDYLRNKVRNLILPGLLEFYPEAENDYYELSRDFRSYFKYERENFEVLLMKYLKKDGDISRISTEILEEKKGANALNHFFRGKGFHKNSISKMLSANQSGGKFKGGQTVVITEPSGFAIMEKTETVDETEFWINQSDLPLQVEAGKFEITWKISENNDTKDFGNFFHFDLNEVRFPICVRSWKKGDKMEIFGSGGHKKISDILIDAKVGIASKNLYPVIDSESGILGITGLKRSNLAKVTPETKEILSIKWQLQNI